MVCVRWAWCICGVCEMGIMCVVTGVYELSARCVYGGHGIYGVCAQLFNMHVVCMGYVCGVYGFHVCGV